MSVRLGTLSYAGSTNIRYWGHIPVEDVIVGNYCSIADNVTFYIDGNHRCDLVSTYPFQERCGVGIKNGWGKGAPKVGHDVWIADGVAIQSGVTLGTGCVVVNYAVVTKDVPPYAIVGGNPAKIIKYRFDEKTRELLLNSKWWDLPVENVAKLLPLMDNVEEFVKAVEEEWKECK